MSLDKTVVMKKHKTKFFLLALLISNLYIFQSCEKVEQEISGNGSFAEEERVYTDFNNITLQGDFETRIFPDTSYFFKIEADENVLPFIETQIVGNELTVSYKDGIKVTDATVRIILGLPEVITITSNGDNTISNERILQSNVLTINAEGKTTLSLNIDVDYLKADISGKSIVNFSGYSKECKMSLSGKGKLTSSLMEVAMFNLKKSGNVAAILFVSDRLIVRSAGEGDIYCKGNPDYIEQDIKGNGQLFLE